MHDIFHAAQNYYKENPKDLEKNPDVLELAKEVQFIIDTAPFLTDGEKRRLKQLLILYPFKSLEQLKTQLLKEGITEHQNHPKDKKMLRWLKLVVQRSKSIKK